MTKRHLVAQGIILGCALTHATPFANTINKDSENAERKIETITVLGKSNVIGAELGGTDLKSLPINSHVVGRAEMERLRFVDPDEFLDRIPGETQVRNLRIPDGSKGYTIPMLDGIPLENPYEGATQRLDRTNTFDIERVEVIKGPASALYPSNAFGGVVNVISRSAPKESERSAFVEAGDFSRFRAGVSAGGTAKNIGYFINANTRNLDGLRDEYVNDKDQISSKFIVNFTDFTELSARLEYIDEYNVQRSDLTAEEIEEDKTQAGNLSSSTDLQQNVLALKLKHLTRSGLLQIDVVRRDKDTVGASRFRGPQDENDLGYSAKILYRHDFNNANLTGGYELYDGTQEVKQYDRDDLALEGDFQAYENDLTIDAYFLQYQIEATDKMNVTAGVRYEDIHVGSSVYSESGHFTDIAPKLGVTYQLSSNNMIWLGLSEGFYAPSASNLFDIDEGNPNLKPEESTNIELGLRGAWKNWSYDSSVYHNDITNYLVTQEFQYENGDEYEQTTNAGQVNIKGVETVIEYAPANKNWRLGLTHTFAKNTYDSFVQSTPGADDDLSGKVLRRSPEHHVNGRIAWLPTEDLTLELEADLYSEYFADNENSDESRFTRGERINLRADYQLNNWKIWLHGLNLTDTLEDRATYSRGTMKFRTIDGRTFYLGASTTF